MLNKSITLIMLVLGMLYVAAFFGWGDSRKAERPQGQKTEQPQASLKEKELKPMPPCQEATAGGPEEVVRTLYRQYPYAGDKSIRGEPEEVIAKYFDERFTGLLIENRNCEQSAGAICAMDVSLMYNTQDGNISDLRVCEIAPGTRTVKVQFRDYGDPRIVTYQLSNTAAGWKVSDIIYAVDSGEYSVAESISGYFSELASGWERAQAPEEPLASASHDKPLPQCEKAKAGGAEDVVRTLYERYPWVADKIIIDESQQVLANFFDESLAALIGRDHECRSRGRRDCGDMPNIMINHEMSDSQRIAGFRVCAMDPAAKTVNVQFRDDGKPVVVTYKLANTPAGWRITDILYLNMQDHLESGEPFDWSMVRALSSK